MRSKQTSSPQVGIIYTQSKIAQGHPEAAQTKTMLVIEVQLPQQEARKKIEWNKREDPTFQELKERLQHSGVPEDWCIEVLHGENFLSLDEAAHVAGPKITMRASPILGDQYLDDEYGDDYQWAKWMKTAFEKVTAHVGRVFVVDMTKPEEVKDPHNVERCVGTVGLMDVHGESICALHCVYRAVEHKERYKIEVVYPNYHKGTLAFEAKPKTMDEDVDLCVLEPVTPLKKPNLPTTYLDLATDAREDDMVYCFFFPKDPLKHETPQVIRQLMRSEKALNASRSNPSRQPADSPTIISGTVCFSEWMQGVATYERLPDPNGGVIVSRSGRVKGIHVKAFTCGELREKVHSENPEELRVAKKLCKKMNSYGSSEGIPVFVPPHGLVRLLGLEGGCELLQAAIRQNKVQMKVQKIKKPKTKSSTSKRPSTRPTRSTRSTRSRTSIPHYKCRAYKSRPPRKR